MDNQSLTEAKQARSQKKFEHVLQDYQLDQIDMLIPDLIKEAIRNPRDRRLPKRIYAAQERRLKILEKLYRPGLRHSFITGRVSKEVLHDFLVLARRQPDVRKIISFNRKHVSYPQVDDRDQTVHFKPPHVLFDTKRRVVLQFSRRRIIVSRYNRWGKALTLFLEDYTGGMASNYDLSGHYDHTVLMINQYRVHNGLLQCREFSGMGILTNDWHYV